MFGSAILEVVVGLAFVYFLLGVIASHINELIAGVLGWRAADLERGIRTLLADPQLADKVWGHPLITGLSGKAGRAPSYVPATTFSIALLDALGAGGQSPVDGIALRRLVSNLPPSSARQALLSLVTASGGKLDQTQTGIADWYNAAMDRVSGIYKRRVLWVTIGVAALLTMFLGVDTVALVTTIWQDQSLRAALSGAAQTQSASGLEDTLNTLSQFNLPIGWVVLPQTAFGWFLKVIGLILTTLAVSLGAPFWFDLLKRFTNPRSSGPIPATQQTALRA
jgi:hypothetical protein